MIIIAIATGRMIQKRKCQVSVLRMNPDRVGPSAGATAMTMVIRPMKRPRACSGTTVMIVVMSSGIIIAVPEACMTRATMSTENSGASAPSRVPAVKRLIARRKTCRVVSRLRR